jgi:hypothetical protein
MQAQGIILKTYRLSSGRFSILKGSKPGSSFSTVPRRRSRARAIQARMDFARTHCRQYKYDLVAIYGSGAFTAIRHQLGCAAAGAGAAAVTTHGSCNASIVLAKVTLVEL